MYKRQKVAKTDSNESGRALQSYTPPRVVRMKPLIEGLGQCAPGSGYTEWQGCQRNGNNASYGCWGQGNSAANNCWWSGSAPGAYCISSGNSYGE